ncbi:MAG: hypothetical protein Q8930_17420 [Bacillota bacterium]|nr:hypothetical protein [Bacillota bacterium]
MFSIDDLISGDFSGYPEEEQNYMKEFNELLRENIKEELINDTRKKIFDNIKESNNDIMNILTDILENGHKGYNNMSTRTLLNIYLEKKGEEDFMKLLDRVGNEMDK